jgi:hypothetical protein
VDLSLPSLPLVVGDIDEDYLAQALARAGRRAAAAGPVTLEELHGGRCSSRVVALLAADG